MGITIELSPDASLETSQICADSVGTRFNGDGLLGECYQAHW